MDRTKDTINRNPWPERLVLFAVSFVFWLLLVWPVSPLDGSLRTGDIVAGLFVSAFVTLVMHDMIRVNLIRLLNPRSWFWLIVYLFVFFILRNQRRSRCGLSRITSGDANQTGNRTGQKHSEDRNRAHSAGQFNHLDPGHADH